MKVKTHNSRGTNGIEYSTHFSLSLVILQQNMYQGVIPQDIIYVREKIQYIHQVLKTKV